MRWEVEENIELLSFLFDKIPKSKNTVKNILKKGNVKVDNKVITQFNYGLKKGQIVSLIKEIETQNYKIPILYEDNTLIAVEKPSGLLTVSSESESYKTLYRYVSDYCKKQNPKNRIFVIHRLDQDTSGIVVFAKNQKVQKEMQDNWDECVQKRGYYAIVVGILKEKKGTIHTWLTENENHIVYSNMKKIGKEAITHYEVIEEKKNSLLKVFLQTGRKNQIRVHMKEIGHPILGDSKYGKKEKGVRLCLHAYLLEFIHPINKSKITLEITLPNEIKKLLNF